MKNEQLEVPNLTSKLRKDLVFSPQVIQNASGIQLFGQTIKSIIYTTDVAVIANCDADAILAVYPWTPNTRILQAISCVANVPFLAGIGGGLTKGLRSVTIGRFAEEMGANGVVLNAPTSHKSIMAVSKGIDVPVFYTVVNNEANLKKLIQLGVNAFNVAGGKETAKLVYWIREELEKEYPNFPIIASGGHTDASIQETIDAGANAITFSASSLTDKIFKKKMELYRSK
ncbi:hydrolase (plasmid) [Enterococcus sp. 22-H-5-01]|uniref:hydrolase n=1 Tax=Enterococcus sp. 22-H-5-01 TaxID=3418555 RepID=UPI003D033936